MIGLAIGDALGVPGEGKSRQELAQSPVVDMRAVDSEIFPAGGWSESTSMSLALLDSLVSGPNLDSMFRHLIDWFRRSNYTAFGHNIKVGETVMQSIFHGLQGDGSLGWGIPEATDNGSLVRTLPLLFYLHSEYGVFPTRCAEAMKLVHDTSALTHPHPECRMACGVAILVASELVSASDCSTAVARGMRSSLEFYRQQEEFAEVFPRFERLFDPSFSQRPVYEITSGEGAVETLEAAVWSVVNTNSFEEAVLHAVNLGGDTDGIGALTGGFAGLFYGIREIPEAWLQTVASIEYIKQCCGRLYWSLVRSKMHNLTPFLPYLESATGVSICVTPEAAPSTDSSESPEGKAPMAAPEYLPEFLEFIDAFYRSNLACQDYLEIIRDSRLALWSDAAVEAVENADLELTLALLTAYVRSERFRVGLWVDAVERKIFYKILRRLVALTEAVDPPLSSWGE